jgi:hypothetical protein
MSSGMDHSTEPSGDDDAVATGRPRRAPMSPAAREHLERTIAMRVQDPEFHRKVEAVRRGLAGESAPTR